jgi:hypothetical protein
MYLIHAAVTGFEICYQIAGVDVRCIRDVDGMRAEGDVGVGDVGGRRDGIQRKVAFYDDADVRVSGQVDGGRLMVPAAARSAQDHTGGCDCERGGAVKYAWGEFDGTAGAIGVERTGRDGIDGVLNGGRVVDPRWQELDLCRDVGRATPPER